MRCLMTQRLKDSAGDQGKGREGRKKVTEKLQKFKTSGMSKRILWWKTTPPFYCLCDVTIFEGRVHVQILAFWVYVCVFTTATSIISVSWADGAGAQQVCSLIPIPLHLPVCPSMFARAHCVLHRETPGLCCTWACCPVLRLTDTHIHTQEHTGAEPVPVTG